MLAIGANNEDISITSQKEVSTFLYFSKQLNTSKALTTSSTTAK